MVLVAKNPAGKWIVSWREQDCYARHRTFGSQTSALRFAAQVECRLEIDAFKQERDGIRAARREAPLEGANDNSIERRAANA